MKQNDSPEILITGTNSGLGKYLHERLGGLSLNRQQTSTLHTFVPEKGVDVIIHCAFNSSRPVTSDSLDKFIRDNILLTQDIVSIPHKKMIYISSIDVYPKTSIEHVEEEVIDLDLIEKFYGVFKLQAEAIVRHKSPNHLILRCAAFLGQSSRLNSLLKIILSDHPKLPLSQDSVFNYVRHVDVANYIEWALQHDPIGIYNVVSSENISLGEAARLLNKQVSFGSVLYDCGRISNKKITAVFPVFSESSRDVIQKFVSLDLAKPGFSAAVQTGRLGR